MMTKAMQNAERLAKQSLNADGYDHAQRVAGLVVEFGEQAVVVALLHDVVEDTDVTLDDIRAEFGDAVATSVEGVTRHALGKETYLDFIYRAKTDAIAKVVKTADVMDHLHLDKTLPSESLRNRYRNALTVLTDASVAMSQQASPLGEIPTKPAMPISVAFATVTFCEHVTTVEGYTHSAYIPRDTKNLPTVKRDWKLDHGYNRYRDHHGYNYPVIVCDECYASLPSVKDTANAQAAIEKQDAATPSSDLQEKIDAHDGGDPLFTCDSCDEHCSQSDLVPVRECSKCEANFNAEEGRNCDTCNCPFTRKGIDAGCPECFEDVSPSDMDAVKAEAAKLETEDASRKLTSKKIDGQGFISANGIVNRYHADFKMDEAIDSLTEPHLRIPFSF